MSFVQNAWYVAALSTLITREPLMRKMLGSAIVLYRSESGGPIALSDTCPHRFAPLHLGQVKGDCIECPYHGLQYGADGICVVSPMGDGKIPKAAKVRSYPTLERDGIVWIWMGDPSKADTSTAPDFAEFLGNGKRTIISGEYVASAHYECVLDNLLDLSHAPFLHKSTLASEDSLNTLRVEMKQEGNTVWAFHYAPNSSPSPQFRDAFPFPKCDMHAHMRWDPPANLQLNVGVTHVGAKEEDGIGLHMLHILTPIDEDNTLYTWVAARNFAHDPHVSEIMTAQIKHAFETEDEPMIQAVWRNMPNADLLSLNPILLPADASGVRARRILQQIRASEAAAD